MVQLQNVSSKYFINLLPLENVIIYTEVSISIKIITYVFQSTNNICTRTKRKY